MIFFSAMTKEQCVELLEVRLLLHEERLLERLMANLDRLNAAVAKLTTDVDAFLAAQPNDQPAIDAAATVVEAADAKVVAATPAPPAA